MAARRFASELPRSIPFEYFQGSTWRPVTMGDFLHRVDEVAAGLIASGVRPGDRVALMASTRYEWVVVDMAVWTAGAITVPVYPSSSAGQVEWILEDSGSRLLIAEGEEHESVLASTTVPDTCSEVLYLDHGDLDLLRDRGDDIGPDEIDSALATLEVDSPASIIYTSGTTGRPKGCVITHSNFLYECHGLLDHPIGDAGGKGKKVMMFLPLAHVLARAVTYTAFLGGATTGFWADTSTLVARFGDFQPHMVLGVPRVFEKVRDGIAKQARAKGRVQSTIFERASAVAIEHSRAQGGDGVGDRRDESLLEEGRYRVYDLLVYRTIRAALGGRCMYAISGGGALSEDLGHFFRGVGVPIYEGYGLTETTAAACVNGPGCQRVGTVGRPVEGTSVRLDDKGEVEVAGRLLFDRYWNNEEATAEAISDGWFNTGDLGTLDDDGYLKIIGRSKELIVTAGGKNVAPGPLEDEIRKHRLIGNAVVLGEGRRFISALVTVDPDELKKWAAENDKEGQTPQQLVADKGLRAEVQYAIDDANALVSHAEGIKKFTVLPKDFSEDGGELTATMKVKRHVVEEKYADEIAEIYGD